MWVTAAQVILRWLGILSCALRTEFQPELGVLTSTKIPYSTQKFSSTAATHLAAPEGGLKMREVTVRFLETERASCAGYSAEMLRFLLASPARGQTTPLLQSAMRMSHLESCCHNPMTSKARDNNFCWEWLKKMRGYNQLWWSHFLEFKYKLKMLKANYQQ